MIKESGGFRVTWELGTFKTLKEAKIFAHAHGWKENKVQVRQLGMRYAVEPFDDCRCPKIIPYDG